MREELKNGNRRIFSKTLAESLAEVLEARKDRQLFISTAVEPPPISSAVIAAQL